MLPVPTNHYAGNYRSGEAQPVWNTPETRRLRPHFQEPAVSAPAVFAGSEFTHRLRTGVDERGNLVNLEQGCATAWDGFGYHGHRWRRTRTTTTPLGPDSSRRPPLDRRANSPNTHPSYLRKPSRGQIRDDIAYLTTPHAPDPPAPPKASRGSEAHIARRPPFRQARKPLHDRDRDVSTDHEDGGGGPRDPTTRPRPRRVFDPDLLLIIPKWEPRYFYTERQLEQWMAHDFDACGDGERVHAAVAQALRLGSDISLRFTLTPVYFRPTADGGSRGQWEEAPAPGPLPLPRVLAMVLRVGLPLRELSARDADADALAGVETALKTRGLRREHPVLREIPQGSALLMACFDVRLLLQARSKRRRPPCHRALCVDHVFLPWNGEGEGGRVSSTNGFDVQEVEATSAAGLKRWSYEVLGGEEKYVAICREVAGSLEREQARGAAGSGGHDEPLRYMPGFPGDDENDRRDTAGDSGTPHPRSRRRRGLTDRKRDSWT
ncbi:hypothetical protein F5X96DRAFT_667676 [Biscogniauxia mediterranea]|nr:hypothetical protein F5X96DRAFT_667676 [Biscogniauxia mediterranea]